MNMRDVPFFLSMSATFLSHRKPTSATTSRDNRHYQLHDKRGTLYECYAILRKTVKGYNLALGEEQATLIVINRTKKCLKKFLEETNYAS